MTQITLDALTASRLHGLSQCVQLCDPSGLILGQFLPTVDSSDLVYLNPEISDEELTRREQEDDLLTTEEVIAHLRSLEERP